MTPGTSTTSATSAAGAVAHALVDLMLPQSCAGCGAAGSRQVCANCRSLLERAAEPADPRPAPPGLPPVWAVAAYQGPVRAMVVGYKERGRHLLRRPLGKALASAIVPALTTPVGAATTPAGAEVVIPVPSRRGSRRRRGYDPVAQLGQEAVAALGRQRCQVQLYDVLGYARNVSDQSGLTARARARNLSGALAVPERVQARVRDRRVIVLDDVITTGATAAEATRALRACGADVRAVAAIAATPRSAHLPPRQEKRTSDLAKQCGAPLHIWAQCD